ncbi:MAG: peptidylprolyl isomerase [Actinobacteria bacterium]|jgi:hypothetical protein|nr:peptidylprolyl isomerase [Actinomycetota bacterium]
MKRFIGLIVVLLAVLVIAAGCDVNVAPYAAQVNGATISRSQLQADVKAIGDSPAYQCVLGFAPSGSSSVRGQGSHTYKSTFVDSVLGNLIEIELVSQALAKHHIPVTPADYRLARAQELSFLEPSGSPGGPGSSCTTVGSKLLAQLPPSYQREQIDNRAKVMALLSGMFGANLSPEGVNTYYKTHASQFVEVCLSGILVSSQAKAAQISAQLAKGASFAALAKADSEDSTSAAHGGRIGCFGPGSSAYSTVEGLVKGLPTGQVSKPTQTSAGWVLLEVNSRNQLPVSAVSGLIREQIVSDHATAFSNYLNRVARKASIVVDPRYGRWVATSKVLGVLPPKAPPSNVVPLEG